MEDGSSCVVGRGAKVKLYVCLHGYGRGGKFYCTSLRVSEKAYVTRGKNIIGLHLHDISSIRLPGWPPFTILDLYASTPLSSQ